MSVRTLSEHSRARHGRHGAARGGPILHSVVPQQPRHGRHQIGRVRQQWQEGPQALRMLGELGVSREHDLHPGALCPADPRQRNAVRLAGGKLDTCDQKLDRPGGQKGFKRGHGVGEGDDAVAGIPEGNGCGDDECLVIVRQDNACRHRRSLYLVRRSDPCWRRGRSGGAPFSFADMADGAHSIVT